MLRMIALAAILSLIGCQKPVEQQSDNTAELQKAQEQIRQLENENAELKSQKPKVKPALTETKVEPASDIDQEYDKEGLSPAQSRNLCWQDYCPCDNPETALDVTICRNAKGGVEMSDDQWAIGAQARDSKREGDRLSREMDGILSEMKAKHY